MAAGTDAGPLRALQGSARALPVSAADDERLISRAGRARLVLLGEATHGTHEFYRERALITKRLIEEMGFTAVAVEADWPDAWRVNRWVRGWTDEPSASEALAGFRRFPVWMWRNREVEELVEWLRRHNEGKPYERQAGFYGLDLYSLNTSIDAVLDYLGRVDPAAARRARERYACFDHFGGEPQAYGYAVGLGLSESCEKEAIEQLIELRRQAAEYASRDGHVAADEQFQAEQNALVVRNAEKYYRAMFQDRVSTWNLRDRHMGQTLEALLDHLGREARRPARVVVWAHNSHLGDARATQMGEEGELNLGQLARMRWGEETLLVGFTTWSGTVTAASDWGAAGERKRVRPALPGSYEELFHRSELRRFALETRGEGGPVTLGEPRLERAIGVIYRPDTERASHYFRARLSKQFDVVLHYDETRAVEPLEPDAGWHEGEPPETYPTGL